MAQRTFSRKAFRRAPWRPSFALLTALVTAAAGLVAIAGTDAALVVPASAQSAPQQQYPSAELINPDNLAAPPTTDDGLVYPGGLFSATTAEVNSLFALENQAVQDTITDYQLAPGDTAAVQTWARPEAEAVLWSLIYDAISSPPGQDPNLGATDQANVNAWMTSVLERQDILSADDAGLEYTKWAGLGAANYAALLASNPTEPALQAFFAQSPVNYTAGENLNTPESPNDEGYCLYQAPAPFQSDWINVYNSGGPNVAEPDCYPGNLYASFPTPPTVQQFEDFGNADADAALMTSEGFTSAQEADAFGFSELGAIVGAGILTAVKLEGSLGAALSNTALGQAIFPHADMNDWEVLSPNGTPSTNPVPSAAEVEQGAEEVATEAGETGEEAVDEAIEVMSTVSEFLPEISIALEATVFLAPLGALLSAITALVDGTIAIVGASSFPQQLAQYVAGANSSPAPDLQSLSQDSGALSGLYNLFVAATGPQPLTGTVCQNDALISIVGAGSSASTAGSSVVPCMNAPAPAAQGPNDPEWVLTPKGSSTSTTQATLDWHDAQTGLDTSTYLAGNWFVDTSTVPGIGTGTVQGLVFDYTDWSGAENVAMLSDSSTSPEFMVFPAASVSAADFDAATCIKAATCYSTPSIEVVGADGTDYTASVSPGTEPPPSPTVLQGDATTTTVTTNAPDPLQALPSGNEATFTATVTSANEVVSGGLIFNGPPPGGTVTFDTSTGPVPGCVELALTQTSSLDAATATASCQVPINEAGPFAVVAYYSGDPYTAGSVGQMVLPVQAITELGLTMSPSNPVVGEPVTFTASVSTDLAAPPLTGSVDFTGGNLYNGNQQVGCGKVLLAPLSAASLNADGTTSATYTATCTVPFGFATTGAGMYATYSGDTYSLSTLSAPLNFAVAQADTTTTLTANPANPGSGQSVTLTATVSAPLDTDGPPLTGAVNIGTSSQCQNLSLSPSAASATYTATCTVIAPSGTGTSEALTASYEGDANTLASSGSTKLTVGLWATSTSISLSDDNPPPGETITAVATVILPAGAPSPTGTVDFTVNAPGTNTDTVSCDAQPLSATATPGVYQATCPGIEYLVLSFGLSGQVEATYSGDSQTATSSASTTLSEAAAPTVTTISPSTLSPHPGEAVTYDVTISSPPLGLAWIPLPSDTLTLTNGGATVCAVSGDTLEEDIVLNHSVSCSETYNGLGPETVTATYSGDSQSLGSSAEATVDVVPAVPAAPSVLTATPAGPGAITFSWQAPSSNSAAPVEGYDVVMGTQSGEETPPPACVALAPRTTCTVTDVTGGTIYYFTVAAFNAAGLGPASNEVSAQAESPLTVATSSLPDATVGTDYSQTLSATGGDPPYGSWSIVGGSLPPGLTLDAGSGEITGAPTAAGNYSFTVSVTDSNPGVADTATATRSLTVDKAPTTTIVSVESGTANFGGALAFGATVTAAGTGGPAVTGSVTFSVDGQQVGNAVPLSSGTAVSGPVAGLAPGDHQITATYTGDANYTASLGSLNETITCSQTLSEAHAGALVVTSSTCVEGGSVAGPVTVRPGGALALVGANLRGPVTSIAAREVLVCGSAIAGPVTLSSASGPVTLGGSSGSACGPDQIGGPLSIFGDQGPTDLEDSTIAGALVLQGNTGALVASSLTVHGPTTVAFNGGQLSLVSNNLGGPLSVVFNTGQVSVTGTKVGGQLTVAANTGGFTLNSNTVAGQVVIFANRSPSAPVVTANNVGGSLSCALNSPAPGDAGSANSVRGRSEGQCATLA